MRYELTDLRLFLAIAEARSLSGGATAVHLTASSASYRLKNLEAAMGVALFTREARGMDLTPEGEHVLRHVRVLIDGVERMQGEVNGFARGMKGSVRVLANSSALNGFIVPSLGRFLSSHPNVNILLEERASGTIEAAIAGGEADIGILAGRVESTVLTAVPYASDELIVVAPIAHPVASHRSLRFAAILDLDLVCMSRNSSNFQFVRDTAKLIGRLPNVRIHAHTFDAVLSLVAAGVGVAVVPRSVAQAAVGEGQVAQITLGEPYARRELTLVTRADTAVSPLVAMVSEQLLADPAVAATRQEP